MTIPYFTLSSVVAGLVPWQQPLNTVAESFDLWPALFTLSLLLSLMDAICSSVAVLDLVCFDQRKVMHPIGFAPTVVTTSTMVARVLSPRLVKVDSRSRKVTQGH